MGTNMSVPVMDDPLPITQTQSAIPAPPPGPRDISLDRHPEMGFGFVVGSEKPVIVRFAKEGGPAEGKLFAQDQILQINGNDVSHLARDLVFDMVKGCTQNLQLTVSQPYPSVAKSSLLSAEKRARLKENPTRVRFADGFPNKRALEKQQLVQEVQRYLHEAYPNPYTLPPVPIRRSSPQGSIIGPGSASSNSSTSTTSSSVLGISGHPSTSLMPHSPPTMTTFMPSGFADRVVKIDKSTSGMGGGGRGRREKYVEDEDDLPNLSDTENELIETLKKLQEDEDFYKSISMMQDSAESTSLETSARLVSSSSSTSDTSCSTRHTVPHSPPYVSWVPDTSTASSTDLQQEIIDLTSLPPPGEEENDLLAQRARSRMVRHDDHEEGGDHDDGHHQSNISIGGSGVISIGTSRKTKKNKHPNPAHPSNGLNCTLSRRSLQGSGNRGSKPRTRTPDRESIDAFIVSVSVPPPPPPMGLNRTPDSGSSLLKLGNNRLQSLSSQTQEGGTCNSLKQHEPSSLYHEEEDLKALIVPPPPPSYSTREEDQESPDLRPPSRPPPPVPSSGDMFYSSLSPNKHVTTTNQMNGPNTFPQHDDVIAKFWKVTDDVKKIYSSPSPTGDVDTPPPVPSSLPPVETLMKVSGPFGASNSLSSGSGSPSSTSTSSSINPPTSSDGSDFDSINLLMQSGSRLAPDWAQCRVHPSDRRMNTTGDTAPNARVSLVREDVPSFMSVPNQNATIVRNPEISDSKPHPPPPPPPTYYMGCDPSVKPIPPPRTSPVLTAPRFKPPLPPISPSILERRKQLLAKNRSMDESGNFSAPKESPSSMGSGGRRNSLGNDVHGHKTNGNKIEMNGPQDGNPISSPPLLVQMMHHQLGLSWNGVPIEPIESGTQSVLQTTGMNQPNGPEGTHHHHHDAKDDDDGRKEKPEKKEMTVGEVEPRVDAPQLRGIDELCDDPNITLLFNQVLRSIDHLLTKLKDMHELRLRGDDSENEESSKMEIDEGKLNETRNELMAQCRSFVTSSKLFVKCATEQSSQMIDHLADCVIMLQTMFSLSQVLVNRTESQVQVTCFVDRLKEVGTNFKLTIYTVTNLIRSSAKQRGEEKEGGISGDPGATLLKDDSELMGQLMNHATSLATSLSALMRTLRALSTY